MISSFVPIFIIIIIFGITIPQYYARRKRMRLQRKRKMLEGENTMTSKLLSECVGKNVELYGEGGISGFVGKVLEVENNLIKIEDKKNIRIINADMIAQIKIRKDKE